MLKGGWLNGEESGKFPVLSLAAHNCHVMKLMFCGIYNLVFMVMVSLFAISLSSLLWFHLFFFVHCIFNLAFFCSPQAQRRQYMKGH